MLLVAIHHWLLNLLIGHQSDFRTFVHADTCRNNSYAQLVIHIRVKRSTDNHSRVVGSKCTDGVTYRFELIQTQVEARRDVNQHAACARQVDIFQQRRRDSHFSSFFRTVFTTRHARTHHCVAHFRHYGAYVCKVHVHQTRTSNQFGDTLHCAFQYVVRCAKRIQQGDTAAQNFQQFVVRDSDQRVHMFGQFSDPLLRECHTLLAFKVERLSDDSNGQDTQIFCHFSDDWCCTCTGTTTHTRSNKDHVCTFQRRTQCIAILISRIAANFWISASAQSFGDTATDLNRLSNRCFTQRLCIGIYREEFNTFNALAHHVFNSITAAAADADDFNHRVIGKFHWFKHSFSPICACRLRP